MQRGDPVHPARPRHRRGAAEAVAPPAAAGNHNPQGLNWRQQGQGNNEDNNNQGGRRYNRNEDDRRFDRRNYRDGRNFNRRNDRNEEGQYDRSENRQQDRNERPMGFRALEEMAQSNDEDVITKVNFKKKSFFNLLESAMDVTEKGDFYVLTLQVLSKICRSPFETLKLKLLLDVCNCRFMNNLRNYLVELPYVTVKRKNSRYWNDQQSFWNNYVTFCQCVIDLSPTTALQKCRSLIEAVTKCCLEGLRDKQEFTAADEYITKFNQLCERLTYYEKEEDAKAEKRQNINTEDSMEPPDDFRELSVLPNRNDLLDERPFLRANVVSGGYRDVDHYLDVQFRLLREDCFGPLRDGITQFMKNPVKKKYDNIRVYHNVTFVEPFISKNKIGETAKLDEKTMKRMKKINWVHSKRFIFGSLLLFTNDNCKSFITATILERDIKLLTAGKIPVSIVDAGVEVKYDSSYMMIESEVYFEPYVHVLKALQEPDFPENLAMRKYIVAVDSEPNPPAYLSPDTVYSVKSDNRVLFKTKFKVLDESTWPTHTELGFNESQYEAYKLALTHEFSVIQGPPGTGKTFLGVKVAQTLLENLNKYDDKCLMLVVCYTNHALDQFLEEILKMTPSVARIGGQSRNKAMEAINLSTLRKHNKTDFQTTKLFYEHKHSLTYAVHELKQAQEKLDSTNKGIISFNCLTKHVPEVNILGNFYAQNRNDVKTDPLQHWLFENMEYVDINRIIEEENFEDQNENMIINLADVDEDNERNEVILDEFDDDDILANDHNLDDVSFSLHVDDINSKCKNLFMHYNRTSNQRTKMELQREIIELRSREKHFNDMAANRNIQTPLRINNRMNLNAVTMQNRWALYFRWANVVINKLKNRMKPMKEVLDTANTAYEEARMIVDADILKTIKVVGMTTTGAARQRKLLQSLAPSIMIVEEAAEVLEQHIVTSLTKHCQHVILIGDHQQLRPSAAHMRLARSYNLEVSLFERMLKNGVHSRRLGVQHRMRPEVAALICPHIYPQLLNHPSVEQFPKVKGMADNVFFFTHDFKEEEVDDSSSKSNRLEADVTLALANYLVQQGYDPSDVTVLTAYSGQMFYMRKQRERYHFLSKVKITVVDNYQGEESKIILLSLVRNNHGDKIGFLGTENRVCVALSRAREGFYILGNMDILKRNSELWTKIAKTLEENESLGSTLMLKCENHPDQITSISTASDFEKVPEGGCLLKCDYELPCGHRCKLVCHGYDRGHCNIKCFEPCTRISLNCNLEHVCPLMCWQKCQPCKRMVQKVLPCGHEKLVYCSLEPTDPSIKCEVKVSVKLPNCGHEVMKPCHMKIRDMKCPVPCITRVDKCGHQCRLTCHVTEDPDHVKYNCLKNCDRAKKGCTANLEGDRKNHQCTRSCYEECEPCTVMVTKKRSNCKHAHPVPCNKDVDEVPCRKNCARSMPCGHFCKKKCFEPCGECKQKVLKVIPDCNHKIKVECMTLPTQDLCKEKCERKLPCGHVCKQQCNQTCDPKLCTEIVQKEFQSPCGHAVMLPCRIYQIMVEERNDDLLLEHCSAPCGMELACDHHCGGSCGRCRQGRLHLACRQHCNRVQICGHLCKEPCNQICPPCHKICEIKCPHSYCNKLCGAPCRPCTEWCQRSCVHGACARRCGEPCSRPPCKQACPLRLRCGHRCRGLCGEPCPDICNICRPDTFPRDFLGDEYDADAKFVQLEDCSHVLDVEMMDTLMMGDMAEVSIRQCPFCRAPIINTQRYKDLINNMIKTQINKIKEKVYGNEKTIKRKGEALLLKVTEFSERHKLILERNSHINKALDELYNVTKKQRLVPLTKIETQFQYIEILDMIIECYKKYTDVNTIVLGTEMSKLIQLLCSNLRANIHKISEQLQGDIGNEIKRMNSIIQLAKLLNHSLYLATKSVPEVKKAAENSIQAVLCCHKFNQHDAVEALEELAKAVKVSGVVTKEERDLIVKAIGSKAGSWYKCPNGHFYSISHCGGAMEVSKCADCGVAIGGQQHRLLASNAHAGEVDGSSAAAWSDAYDNMANFLL